MENLRQLMAAYFHQDWFDEYGGSWEAAVEDFVRREPSRAEGTAREITELTRTGSDIELAKTVEALGSFYWAGDEPSACRAWVEGIKARLEARPAGGTPGRSDSPPLASDRRRQA